MRNFCGQCGAPQRPVSQGLGMIEARSRQRMSDASGGAWSAPLSEPGSRAALPTAVERLPPKPLLDELSARRTWTRGQLLCLAGGLALIGGGLALSTRWTLVVLIAVATVLYVGATVYRIRTFARAMREPRIIHITDGQAASLAAEHLPTYTILVPLYREADLVPGLLRRLEALDYPRDRLDIKLLLEEDDAETLRALREAATPLPIETVIVPYSEPRTKPKALNVGLRLARGPAVAGIVTIYDAEDRPEPLQLRRAVAAFRALPTRVACLQAKLAYHNPHQNILTRWFAIEYAQWFNQLLPGLVDQAAPLPLGGTSNHFRRGVLERLGGWDPYNVTEDADLGLRLHRFGYRTEVFDSITYEEANSDFINWVKQRSRWYKGYMQTWLVHMRRPGQLWEELGTWGFLGFHLFVGGTPLLALLNPIFWGLTAVWFLAGPPFVQSLFPGWIYYVSLACLVFGNFTFLYTSLISARASGDPRLVLSALLSPVYWVMMSIAAIKAFVQLVGAPSFWEKTMHGLDRPPGGTRERAAG